MNADALPKPKKGWSTWSPLGKAFAVVAVAMFVSAVLLFGVMVVSGIWLYTPGSQVSSARAIAPGTKTLGQIHVDIDDPGVSRLIGRVATEVDELARARRKEELPENLRFLANLQRTQARDMIEMFWPRDVTVAVSGQEAAVTSIVNPRRFGGAIRAFFAALKRIESENPPIEYRDHSVVSMDAMTMTNATGSVLVATTTAAMFAMIDRVEESVSAPVDPELWALSERLRAGSDAHVVFAGVPQFLGENSLDDAVLRTGLSADLVDDDTLTGELHLHPKTGEHERVAETTQRWMDGVTEDLRSSQLALTTTTRTSPEAIVVQWKMTGVARYVLEAVATSMFPPE